jgi:phosphoribosyl-AMP cyclohydrolase / phosphoribosyl-ATP pyrophosphohydrolase
LTALKFNEKGLIPAIVQDADSREVLMLAYMNEASLKLTLESGEAWFYSRSRQELWHKGATSGNIIKVVELWQDCDSDTILIIGRPKGPVCHTGNRTCFFEKLTGD